MHRCDSRSMRSGVLPELGPVQLREGSSSRDQVVPGALFDHAAVVHDQDLVRVTNSRKSMRDDDQRPTMRTLLDRPSDALFDDAVQGRGGFVQNQDVGISQKGASECSTLALSGGQLNALESARKSNEF